MSCSPLAVGVGPFVELADGSPGGGWAAIPPVPPPEVGQVSAMVGNATLTRASNGGLSIAFGTGAGTWRVVASGRSVEYLPLHPDALLLLWHRASGAPETKVEFFSPHAPTGHVLGSGSWGLGPALARPVVRISADGSAAFLWYWQLNTAPFRVDTALVRADTGIALWTLAGQLAFSHHPIEATAQAPSPAHSITVRTSATAPGGQRLFLVAMRSLEVQPQPVDFPRWPWWRGPDTRATRRSTVRVSNIGADCTTISAIGDVPPFRVLTTSPPLPADLAGGGPLDVTLEFRPPTGRNVQSMEALPISGLLAAGATTIPCHGAGRDSYRELFRRLRPW